MKNRSYKELEEKKPPISDSDIEDAKARFLSSGGTVQVVDEDSRKSRKQKQAVAKYVNRYR